MVPVIVTLGALAGPLLQASSWGRIRGISGAFGGDIELPAAFDLYLIVAGSLVGLAIVANAWIERRHRQQRAERERRRRERLAYITPPPPRDERDRRQEPQGGRHPFENDRLGDRQRLGLDRPLAAQRSDRAREGRGRVPGDRLTTYGEPASERQELFPRRRRPSVNL